MFDALMRFVPAGRRADVATASRQAVIKVSAWLRAQFVLAGVMGVFAAIGLVPAGRAVLLRDRAGRGDRRDDPDRRPDHRRHRRGWRRDHRVAAAGADGRRLFPRPAPARSQRARAQDHGAARRRQPGRRDGRAADRRRAVGPGRRDPRDSDRGDHLGDRLGVRDAKRTSGFSASGESLRSRTQSTRSTQSDSLPLRARRRCVPRLCRAHARAHLAAGARARARRAERLRRSAVHDVGDGVGRDAPRAPGGGTRTSSIRIRSRSPTRSTSCPRRCRRCRSISSRRIRSSATTWCSSRRSCSPASACFCSRAS